MSTPIPAGSWRSRGGPVSGNALPQINPFVGLFIAIGALNAGVFVWLRAEIAIVREDVVDNGERLARIEATVEDHGKRLTGIEAGLAELLGELASTNERMARIEGTVAGALRRPFPERMVRPPRHEESPEG